MQVLRAGENPLLLMRALLGAIPHVPFPLLERHLSMCAALLRVLPPTPQRQMLKHAYDVIANNYDYIRKETCVRWYLHTHAHLQERMAGSAHTAHPLEPAL